tara:strand:+ start:406 stop:684 length:279 start_codon:yes stop_codon:yes gene_type:complete
VSYIDDYEDRVAAIRARIAALRSRLASGNESFEDPLAQRIQYTTERPKEEKRVEPRVEPNWDAIAKLTAENDAKEAKAAELTAMKAKLMGKK